jgi:hypothetical protein
MHVDAQTPACWQPFLLRNVSGASATARDRRGPAFCSTIAKIFHEDSPRTHAVGAGLSRRKDNAALRMCEYGTTYVLRCMYVYAVAACSENVRVRSTIPHDTAWPSVMLSPIFLGCHFIRLPGDYKCARVRGRCLGNACRCTNARLLAVAQAHGFPLGWHASAHLSHAGLYGPWKHLHGPGA